MTTLRATWRLFAFIASLVWHAIPLWVRAARGPIDWTHHQAVRQRFAQSAMRILGIDLTVVGTPYAEGSCVYASNHRSWLDPFAELAVLWAFPVAKAEVGKLPFVAQGARATGILFVDRGDRGSRRAVVDAMVAKLRTGFSILIYPEGTTSTEAGTKDFQKGGFLVAKDAGRPVVPLAVVYPRPDYHWADGVGLWQNFVQVAGQPTTPLTLYIGEARQVTDVNEACRVIREEIDGFIRRGPAHAPQLA